MQTRTFTFPAQYRRFVEAQIALALADVKRDRERREDEDPRIQAMATVPNQLVDTSATGRCSIVVHVDATPSLPTPAAPPAATPAATPEAKTA